MVAFSPLLVSAQKKSSSVNLVGYNISSGDPDTALAFFLWQNALSSSIDISLHREEYFRWNLESAKISPLIGRLFNGDPLYKKKMKAILEQQQKTLRYARVSIIQSYKSYSSVSDEMEFEFLLKRKDPVLSNLMEIMLIDTAVSEKEKSELRTVLKKLR